MNYTLYCTGGGRAFSSPILVFLFSFPPSSVFSPSPYTLLPLIYLSDHSSVLSLHHLPHSLFREESPHTHTHTHIFHLNFTRLFPPAEELLQCRVDVDLKYEQKQRGQVSSDPNIHLQTNRSYRCNDYISQIKIM